MHTSSSTTTVHIDAGPYNNCPEAWIYLVVSGTLFFSPTVALSAEWSLKPAISVEFTHETNVNMVVTDTKDASSFRIAPSVTAGWNTETTSIEVSTGITEKRYNGDRDLDRTDINLNINAAHRTELNSWGLTTNFRQDSTLDSELEETGVVLNRTTRNYWLINPSWTHSFSPQISVKLNYSLTKAEYPEGNSGLAGYTYQSAGSTLNYRLSNNTTLSSSLSTSLYTSGDNTSESRNTGIQLSMSHGFSEDLNGSFEVGSRKTTSTQLTPTSVGFILDPATGLFTTAIVLKDVETTQTGTTLSASLTKDLYQGSLTANLSRSVSPSGNNSLIVRDQISLSGNHRFNERQSFSLSASWYSSSSSTTSSTTAIDQQFLEIAPRLYWKLTQDLSFSASYRYRKQELASTQDTVTSNSIQLRLDHQWPKIVK